MSITITARPATRQDVEAIHNLRLELARWIKMDHLPMLSAKELERDGFDVDPPCYQCLVVDAVTTGSDSVETVTSGGKRVVGYALYYDIYPVWEGRGLMLQDLCVSEDFRGKGVGELLLRELAKIGVAGNYSRITLKCQIDNPARKFYQKNHGVDVSESEGWNLLQLPNAAVKKLADRL